MKLEVKKTVTEEIEVEFPFYTKTIAHVFKHVNESKCISIFKGHNGLTFDYSQHDYVSSEWMNAERATKEEFEAAKAEFIRRMNEPHD